MFRELALRQSENREVNHQGWAATKTSLENSHLRNGDYFAIIASSSHSLLLTEGGRYTRFEISQAQNHQVFCICQ